MPISVVCPGCKARFAVSEKFAGKKGPCPKCKAVILVPDVPAEDVKIHVPEQFASGGKDSKGRPVSKPIARKETKFKPAAAAAIGGVRLGDVDRGAFAARRDRQAAVHHRRPGRLVAAVGGGRLYVLARRRAGAVSRAEPHAVRAALCAAAYAALWGAYYPLPGLGIVSGEMWQWLFVAPAFVTVGAAVAWACFDLDFGSAAMHYCFYIVVTLLLCAALGLPPLWATTSGMI